MRNAERKTTMKTKSILQSKTFWLQILTFIAVLFPAVQAWLVKNPETAVAVLGAVNVLLRFATSGKITLSGAGETKDNMGGGRSGGTWLLVMGLGLGTAAAGMLSSCSPDQLAAARAVPVRSCVETDYGTVCYSSKSGIAVTVDATSRK